MIWIAELLVSAKTLHKIRFALHGAPTSKGREGPPYSFTLNVSVAIVLCLSLEFVDDQFHVLFASKTTYTNSVY